MSHINRAIVQVPLFLVVAGIGLWWNWRPISWPSPPKEVAPMIAAEVIERAEEEILRIRGELNDIRAKSEYSKNALPVYRDAAVPSETADHEASSISTLR